MFDGIIAVNFIGTKDNIADPLTKGLALALVQKSRLGMGLKPTRDSQAAAIQPN